MVSTIANNPGIWVQSSQFDVKNINVYGNISLNTQNQSKAIVNQYIDYLSRNYTANPMSGFVSNTVPYDFHLTASSPAKNFANGEPSFPATDKDGNTRSANNLDAGAYQATVTGSSSPSPVPPKPGDANGDNMVNEADYTLWLSHYGQTISGIANGDFNGDNTVNGIDYVVWLNNYGK